MTRRSPFIWAGAALLLSSPVIAPPDGRAASQTRGNGGSMTREDAIKLVQAFFQAHGKTSRGLNDKGFGGLLFGMPSGAAQVFFEHDAELGQLVCRAHLFTYRPQDSVEEELKAFREEEKAGTPMGDGRLEYMQENRGLFLTRTYSRPVADRTFVAEVDKLAAASLDWRGEVFERVMDKLQASRSQRPR